jgi:hypothetical protein
MTEEDQKHIFRKIQKYRALAYTLFLIFIPYGLLSAYLSENNIIHMSPIIPIMIYIVALAIISFKVAFSKCQNCGNFFFFRSREEGKFGDTGNKNLNFLFGGGYRNLTAKSCLNCGANLKT